MLQAHCIVKLIRNISIFAICILAGVSSIAQTDNTGPGHCIHFDGVDDYVDIGDVYNNITFPFTFSVWVNVDANNTLALPIFASQDDDALYNGFWLYVTPSTIFAEFGDGLGQNNINFRRGRQAAVNQNIFGKWNHIAYVIKNESNVDIYLNGVQLPTVPSSGLSPRPMDSNSTGHASIGRHKTSALIQRFVGDMDEVRIFNYALTATQIRQQMCSKVSGTESGLIGYWRFDETSGTTAIDLSPNGFNGLLIGAPTQLFSGAPVGDESTFVYSTTWSGVIPTLTFGTKKITITDIQNNPDGAHIYKVNNLPSQTSGLGAVSPPYFGAFMASTDFSTIKKFHVNYSQSCSLYQRNDNTVPNWITVQANDMNFVNRQEFIEDSEVGTSQVDITGVENGALICDQKSVTLSVHTSSPDALVTWSTGATASSINVSKSGTYSVEVSENCSTGSDDVTVEIFQSPQEFSLGQDLVMCSVIPFDLKPVNGASELDFTWQDGSADSIFHVSTFGTYWVTIENECGTRTDTLTIAQPALEPEYVLPNVITPDGDTFNQEFQVHPLLVGSALSIYNRWGKSVYESGSYENNWSGDNVVSGVYYYRLHHYCLGDFKGWIEVIR